MMISNNNVIAALDKGSKGCVCMAENKDDGMISKKDLLKETGISYGQLYRWKREQLLPERWFVKRSVFTGQETFFPRDQALERVRAIIDLKDQYSLEELARMFSPDQDPALYTKEELARLPEVDGRLLTQYEQTVGKKQFQYVEAVMLYMMSQVRKTIFVDADSTEAILRNIAAWAGNMDGLSYRLLLLQYETGMLAAMLSQREALETLFLDSRLKVVADVLLEDISKEFQLHQQSVANL